MYCFNDFVESLIDSGVKVTVSNVDTTNTNYLVNQVYNDLPSLDCYKLEELYYLFLKRSHDKKIIYHVKTPNHNNNNILSELIKRNQFLMVEALLMFGVSPNGIYGTNDVPLHTAIIKKYYRFIPLLLSYGADMNLQLKGKTIIHLLIAHKIGDPMSNYIINSKLIIYLINNGANPLIKNYQGKTPKDIVKMRLNISNGYHIIYNALCNNYFCNYCLRKI